jgi:formylglycine-generating enzyme required for sulfatase activity
MADLYPCPNPSCSHWNPIGRDRCFRCKVDLTQAGPAAPSRPGVLGKVPLIAGIVLVVAGGGYFALQQAAIAGDDTKPEVILDTPQGPEVRIRTTSLQVAGRVEDDHPERVQANDKIVPLEDGAFSITLEMTGSGGNVQVVARDRAGNFSDPVNFRVMVDPDPPAYVTLEPSDGSIVALAATRVSGTASEDLATVTVDGTAGEVAGATFSVVAALQPGSNDVVVTITDLAGNTAERKLALRLEERKLPPGLAPAGRTVTGHDLFSAAADGASLVLVPGGAFTMGSDEGDADERPAHEVVLAPFFIDVKPVTNAQYARFCEATGHAPPAPPAWDAEHASRAEHPVVNVSWNDAEAYARWAGRRLPTEAEWEKAARGTREDPFPWGTAAPDGERCNFKGEQDQHATTSPAGAFPKGASPFGVLDMAGNVWEWTADHYAEKYYRTSPAEDPRGPASGGERVLRGASFTSEPADLRVTNRYKRAAGDRKDNVGFRTAASFSE